MFVIENMCEWELAAFVQDSGTNVVCSHGVWWVEHQPFFYRPLVPLMELAPSPISRPGCCFTAGFQHDVPDTSPSNSTKSHFLFEFPQHYAINDLSHGRANKIRKGERHFSWRKITDSDHFIAQAYPVYRDFSRRVNYGFKNERNNPKHFANWARALFRHPKVVVSGAYIGNRLCAVSIYYLVNDIFVNATYYSDSESQPLQVHEFVLHKLRMEAARTNARFIYMGPYTGIEGIDRAKLDRGCSLVVKRTNLHLNPIVSVMMKWFRPVIYARIRGDAIKARDMDVTPKSIQPVPVPSRLVCNSDDEVS